MQEAVSGLGVDANYSANSSGSLRGSLRVRVPGENEVCTLDLQQAPERLFAVELVSTWRTVLNAAADTKTR